MARIGRYVAGSLVVGYGALQILGRQAGSTAEERWSRMPGDELVARPQILTNHAITIEARVGPHAEGLAPVGVRGGVSDDLRRWRRANHRSISCLTASRIEGRARWLP